MTRINIIPPKELMDQHLVAEYREILMVGAALQRSLKSKNGVYGIPERYTLNKGHVKFFYDKGTYLHNRYKRIIKEMRHRGMNPDPSRKFNIHHFPKVYQNNWEPLPEDILIIKERIALRISQKPTWYRYSR